MPKDEFEEGMLVAISSGYGRDISISRVKRKTKRFVELESGGKWQLDGWDTYPKSGGSWSTGSIRPATEDDITTVRRQKMIRKLQKVDWKSVETEVLESCFGAVS